MMDSFVEVGQVIRTPGFGLNCTEVYHVVLEKCKPDKGKNVLSDAMRLCLALAESSGYASIAFPALGSGGFRYLFDDFEKELRVAVGALKFTNLRKVTLVLYPGNQDPSVEVGLQFAL